MELRKYCIVVLLIVLQRWHLHNTNVLCHLVDKLWWGASQSQRIPTKHPFSDFILLLCHNLFESQCMRDSQKLMYGTETKRSATAANTKAVVVPLINPENFSFFVHKPIQDMGSPLSVRNNDNTVETALP